jgi:hypothetical protein
VIQCLSRICACTNVCTTDSLTAGRGSAAQVVAEGEGWQPRTWRPGSVGLPAAAGASATVEASWLPTAPGASSSCCGTVWHTLHEAGLQHGITHDRAQEIARPHASEGASCWSSLRRCAAGPLPVPRLQLLDVAQQEVFDGGLAADTVYVMPPDS